MKATTLLTSKDIAARLKVDAHTVRKWRKAGQIPAGIEIGGVIRWRPEDIDAFVAAGGAASIRTRSASTSSCIPGVAVITSVPVSSSSTMRHEPSPSRFTTASTSRAVSSRSKRRGT